jgi:hypothetical protein
MPLMTPHPTRKIMSQYQKPLRCLCLSGMTLASLVTAFSLIPFSSGHVDQSVSGRGDLGSDPEERFRLSPIRSA